MSEDFQITQLGMQIANYYFPFKNSKQILFKDVVSMEKRPLTLLNGKMRIWGMGTSLVWLPLDRERFQKKWIYVFDLGRFIKVGITPEQPGLFEQSLRKRWHSYEDFGTEDIPQIKNLITYLASQENLGRKNQFFLVRYQQEVLGVFQWFRSQSRAIVTAFGITQDMNDYNFKADFFWALVDHLADKWINDIFIYSNDDEFWEAFGLEKVIPEKLLHLGQPLPNIPGQKTIYRKSLTE